MSTTTDPKDMAVKQPAEVTDYDWDWGPKLAARNDTLQNSTVTCADPSLTLVRTEMTTTVVKQWYADGIADQDYKVTCSVHTVGGRDWEAEMWIRVREL